MYVLTFESGLDQEGVPHRLEVRSREFTSAVWHALNSLSVAAATSSALSSASSTLTAAVDCTFRSSVPGATAPSFTAFV